MEKAIKKWWPVFVLPTLGAFIIGFIIPFIQGVYLSLCQFTTVKDAVFIGLDNFTRAFADSTFTHAFWYNCAFVVVTTIAINVGGLAVALILTRAIRGTNAFRTVFFMPNLIGGIVLGYIWQILLNCVLALLERPLLELDATAGFWGLVILMCWQQIGYMMIIYVAGLQSIPRELYEAAELDGAGLWKKFVYITVPALRPTTYYVMVNMIIGSFNVFIQVMMLTGGNPNGKTSALQYLLYDRAFNQFEFGEASAIGLISAVTIVAITFLLNRRLRLDDVEKEG